MTIFAIAPWHLRFAIKLTCAVALALFISLYFHLETPRWALLTASLVTAGPAFSAGGEPYSGAIRHRGMLRIIGTFIGCIAALAMLVILIRVPLLMLLVCCLWMGFCTWLSSLVRIENSYAWGLSGYTALIIIIAIQYAPLLALQVAIERCSEIVLGIVCAITADLLFSPRSIKNEIDLALDNLQVEQYQLMQLCIAHSDNESVDKAWNEVILHTKQLDGMRNNLNMESSRWGLANRRLRGLNSLSLMLNTLACETWILQNSRPETVTQDYRALFAEPVNTVHDVHQQLKKIRRLLIWKGEQNTPLTIYSWVGAATRFQVLKRGVTGNTRISRIEENILKGEGRVKARSAEYHQAMVNFWRTSISCILGVVFWLWTGWTSGSSAMMMISIITSVAMRTPNPKMVAVDFLFGALAALPLGALFFLLILPSTQQSMLLLCTGFAVLAFFVGIEVQKRRLGSLGALASTVSILGLSNPMVFHFEQFIDAALGQIVGCVVALMVILVVRDHSRARTGRVLLNKFVSAAISAMTTNIIRRQENHLPALYQQFFLLLNLFPGDTAKFRLALALIVAHQRLRDAPIPINDELSAFHQQLQQTADRVITATSDDTRRHYFSQLLEEMTLYQQKLLNWAAPLQVTEPVRWLTDILSKYQHALTDS